MQTSAGVHDRTSVLFDMCPIDTCGVSCVSVGSFQSLLKRVCRYFWHCARRPPIPSTNEISTDEDFFKNFILLSLATSIIMSSRDFILSLKVSVLQLRQMLLSCTTSYHDQVYIEENLALPVWHFILLGFFMGTYPKSTKPNQLYPEKNQALAPVVGSSRRSSQPFVNTAVPKYL
eukprot:SAG22_NODE_353_length_11812_cov_58.910783_3_plen_175_part_00